MKKNLPVTGKERTYGKDVAIISTTDLKGIITYINPEFVDISGFSEEELIGKNHNIIRHPDMPPAAFKDLWDTVKKGQAWHGMVKNRCKNGDHYWVDAFVTPISENGEINGYQSVRTLPTRKQINAAEALYKEINAKHNEYLPKRRRITNIGLRSRIWGATIFTVLLIGIGAFASWQGFDAEPASALSAWRQLALFALLVAAGSAIVTTWLIQTTALDTFKQISAITRGIAGGNLRHSITIKNNDELNQTLLGLKLMQARLRMVFGRFTDTTKQIAGIAERLSDTSRATKEGMEKQQMEVEQAATAMTEMSATVRDVAANTEQAASNAEEAAQKSENGAQIVTRTQQTIQGLADEVHKSEDVIRSLEATSTDIGTIMDVIKNIAEQTNLLALNAAIEAARAGDQGRGFAVVADEVRALSMRTQEATKQIQSMIQQLQTGIEQAVAVMGKGQGQAARSVTEAEKTHVALNSIRDSILIINDMMQQIATAATEQSAVAEEINRNLVTVTTESQSVAETAHINVDDSEILKKVAEKLRDQLSFFKL
jgi:aerotaxis receptor